MKVENIIISNTSTIREALTKLDETALGVLFVVDKSKKLTGVLTDGDIRRAFIDGLTPDTIVSEVIQKEFVSLPVNTSVDIIQSKLSVKIRYIPLVDENFHPVDYASQYRLHRIPIMEPLLDGNELAYVTDCVKSGWVSSQGVYVKRFEKMLAEFCGMPFALAVSNGTVALHLALETLGINEGDEVIVPDLTFAASINSIIYTGATPVMVDIDRDTWTMDISSLEKAITPKTKAIMPVHLYGHPCRMDEISALAKKHKLFIVEDCAEALGSQYKGKPIGLCSDIATFSFFGNKTITTGEGGMMLFKRKEDYEKAAVLRDHGMSKQKKYWHDFIGYNYRMTNLQAAIGVAQMERVEVFINAKRKLAQKYNSILMKHKGIILPAEMSWAKNSYWLYTILVDKKFGTSRDELIAKLLKNGVETRPVFYPLHVMSPYKKYVRTGDVFTNAEYVSENGMSLPSSVSLSKEEVEHINEAIDTILNIRQILT